MQTIKAHCSGYYITKRGGRSNDSENCSYKGSALLVLVITCGKSRLTETIEGNSLSQLREVRKLQQEKKRQNQTTSELIFGETGGFSQTLGINK